MGRLASDRNRDRLGTCEEEEEWGVEGVGSSGSEYEERREEREMRS
jgi:hypothetical protein